MSMSAERRRSYTGARSDLIALLPDLQPGSVVIDVGCSNGATASALKGRTDVRVIGIEADSELAAEALAHVDRMVVGDATSVLGSLAREGVCADAVVFGDVLEHLVDPWACVDAAIAAMPAGGIMVASLPNVAHWDTLVSLLRGSWPQRDRGIHDDTHLRFFARKDLARLFERDRSAIVSVDRIYRIVERPHRFNRRARLVGRLWPNVFTFQFHVMVRVNPGS